MVKGQAATQLALYEPNPTREQDASSTPSTFLDNLSLPIHRWFRYSAGFSALWVRELIEREKAVGRRSVFDPFAGSGTSILEAESADIDAFGIEAHPFVARIARAKLLWRSSVDSLLQFSRLLLKRAEARTVEPTNPPKLLQECFPTTVLRRLFSLREAWNAVQDGSPASELCWLALMAILRECSPVGTAQWQYVLPNKAKANILEPFRAFELKTALFASDMALRQRFANGRVPKFRQDDARVCREVPDGWAELVVTSPPYANNYDYADATRLEMTFAGQIRGWGNLHTAVRKYLVRSCSQHVSTISPETENILAEPELSPIRDEIQAVCRRLAAEREIHGGKKTYHTMVAAYFSDMARVWASLRRVAKPGALVCFVVGDSAPYGVYVAVERWLGELALAAGFHSYSFEKTRDRNVKWKNRKHRVPLKEGRLWVEG